MFKAVYLSIVFLQKETSMQNLFVIVSTKLAVEESNPVINKYLI